MSFTGLPLGLVVAGALALAAVLAVLQLLRTRRRTVRMASARLFARMPKPAPANALFGRFRQVPAYLLALAIVLLLWIVFARPEGTVADDGRFHELYLDASALMVPGDNFADATAALQRRLDELPARDRRVTLGDAYGTLLLAPGEDALLLPARLASYRPQPTPSAFRDWFSQYRARRLQDPRPVSVQYFGSAGAFAGLERAELERAGVSLSAGFLAEGPAANRGITALGIAPAASGAWDRVDAMVEGYAGRGAAVSPTDLRVSIDGDTLDDYEIAAAGAGRFVLRDLEARGGTLEVALREGDGLAVDDSAAILLPDLRPVRVAIGAGVPEAIRRVIALDPALEAGTPGDASVAVRLDSDDDFAPGLPTFFLTPPDAQNATVFATTPDGTALGSAELLAQLGITPADASRLADQLSRPVTAAVAEAPLRSVSVWAPVLSANTAFARSPALPLFVSRSLRWLASPPEWTPYASAGQMLAGTSALFGSDVDGAERDRALNDALFLPEAGDIRIGDEVLAVAFTDADSTRAADGLDTGDVAVADSSPLFDPRTLVIALLLAALALLAAEWRLFHRRRMP